eukprot:jgi/Chrzof1/9586/Cz04g08140.t1
MALLASLSGFFMGSSAHNVMASLHMTSRRQLPLHLATDRQQPDQQAIDSKVDSCHTEAHAEYAGEDVLVWGSNHLVATADACCQACQQKDGCNVWVWCADPAGCGVGRDHQECWLKKQQDLNPLHIKGIRNPASPWTSGALYSDAAKHQLIGAEQQRVTALKNDTSMPLVYLDVAIKGSYIGRITMVLFSKEAPRAANNFRALCTGEKGLVPEGREGAGKRYHFKGNPFYRIIDEFIDQAGAGTESVYGGQFKDDPGGLALKHNRKGLLSMANTGPDTNTSHFSIMMGPAPHLDGKYTIFGEVVEGFEVMDAINALSHGKKDNTATAEDGAVIVGSGQLR